MRRLNLFRNFFHNQAWSDSESPYQPTLPGADRDFSEFARDDTFIKVWLPDKLLTAVDELAEYFDNTRSRLLRGLLFVHVYGMVDFEAMRCRHLGLFAPQPGIDDGEGIKFSRTGSATTAHLGKSRNNLKLHLPSRLLEDLQKLAARAGVPRSQYLREVLVSVFLGYGQLPARRDLVEAPAEAEDDDGPGATAPED
ncbi:MAG: hypothetical protein GX442_13800 [Candidatus Riflebacteria bacterium]|nr:hypothetical protein [Candidatus Riflebacteria bacterium]